jgi:hypothetical protein
MAKNFKNKDIQTPDGEIKLKLGKNLAFDILYPYTYIFVWSFVLSSIKNIQIHYIFGPIGHLQVQIFCGNCYCSGLFLRLACAAVHVFTINL